jgi:signal transduction histidine kinase
LAFGIIISGVFGLINSALIPLITNSYEFAKYSPYGIIFLLIFTAYSITKYHLFNIRVVATQLLVLLISLILLIQAFLSKTINEGLIRGGFFILVVYFGYLLIKSVILEIERRKEVEVLANKLKITNADLLTLQHINNKMVSTLDVKKVSQDIVESLSTELSWKGGFLALINDEKEKIYIEAITKKIGRKVAPLLKKPVYKYSLSVRGSESIIQKSIHRLEIEYTNSFEKLIFGAISSNIAKKIQKRLNIKTFSSSPIVYRGKVIGVLISGFAKPISKISAEEKKMISSISDQAAIAIENAKLYQEIEKANIKLKELDKLKNEFLSIASHQVRTPLSIIKGYISLLRGKKAGEISEQQDHFMKNIQEANDQLINIINDFLNLSRIEQKRMKLEISESDVKKTIEQVLERLNHEAELKNIKLNFIKEVQDIPKINIDEPKMIEVITNLVDNAIKYSPKKSEIKVTLKKDGDRLKISVTDHGIGIPEDFRDKLFQKFSRAHNAIQHQPNGNGIGLFLVKKIIDAHHGKLSVSSKEGKGTTLTVYLNYKSGLKPGEEVDATELTKKGIIRYEEYEDEKSKIQNSKSKKI